MGKERDGLIIKAQNRVDPNKAEISDDTEKLELEKLEKALVEDYGDPLPGSKKPQVTQGTTIYTISRLQEPPKVQPSKANMNDPIANKLLYSAFVTLQTSDLNFDGLIRAHNENTLGYIESTAVPFVRALHKIVNNSDKNPSDKQIDFLLQFENLALSVEQDVKQDIEAILKKRNIKLSAIQLSDICALTTKRVQDIKRYRSDIIESETDKDFKNKIENAVLMTAQDKTKTYMQCLNTIRNNLRRPNRDPEKFIVNRDYKSEFNQSLLQLLHLTNDPIVRLFINKRNRVSAIRDKEMDNEYVYSQRPEIGKFKFKQFNAADFFTENSSSLFKQFKRSNKPNFETITEIKDLDILISNYLKQALKHSLENPTDVVTRAAIKSDSVLFTKEAEQIMEKLNSLSKKVSESSKSNPLYAGKYYKRLEGFMARISPSGKLLNPKNSINSKNSFSSDSTNSSPPSKRMN